MRRALFALAGLALLAPTQMMAQDAAPKPRTIHQKLQPCKVEGLEEEVLCGTLSVWENRTTRSGRKIDLHMVVVPAKSPNPAPDPLVYISGGPGYGSAPAAGDLAQFLGDFRQDRDLLFLDQRGTGKSHPLRCDQPGSYDDLQTFVRELFPLEALRACRPQLAAQADLLQYTTDIAMADLDEVRAWLGYERINLFGGSYGSRAAQVYMRQYPQHVRSAVLDGVVLMDARMPFHHARKAQESLDKLIDDCGREEACRTAFPDLRGDLWKVIARLDKGPVRQTVKHPKTGQPVTVELSKSAFTTTLRAMQYSPYQSLRIPRFLHRAAQGDFEPMVLETIRDRDDDGWAIGMYLSVTCAEDVARIDPKEVAAAVAGTYQGDDRIRQQVEACSFWPTTQLPASFWEPLTSVAPTLILTGWFDPATPPEWAVEVARHLPNSLNVVVRDASHGPGGLSNVECHGKLIADFVRNGTPYGLDTSCTLDMKRAPFPVTDEPAAGGA